MNKIKKILLALLIVFSLVIITGCNKKNEPDLSGYSMNAQKAIKDFVKSYGKNSKGYNNDAYVVSDFDNTTSIFDITYQCSVYQIETMAFKLTPAEMRSVLSIYTENDETSQKYINDIVSAYTELVNTFGEFTPHGVSDNNLDELHSNLYYKEFSTKLKSFYLYVEGIIDDPSACAWILYWYTNMSENEVYELFKRSCLKYQYEDTKEVTWTSPSEIDSEMGIVSCSFLMGCSVTSSAKNMLKYYKDNGIDVWICSASHVDGVRAAVDAFGLSDVITGVIGMTQKVVDGKLVSEYDYENGYPYVNNNGSWTKADKPIKALPSRDGKVKAISNFLVPRYNKGPLAGFMDASGDFNFCTEFESMKLVICYNRADRKITEGAGLVAIAAMYQKDNNIDLSKANKNGDTLYILQGRDENGRRSLRESEYTLKYDAKDEKLLANDSNVTLLNYVKENKLSLKNFFDTFALETSKDDSLIGIAHGYLGSYAGYHNIKE